MDYTKFQPYSGAVPGIEFYVNTSHCQFASTPIYLTSLTGTSSHWYIVGVSSIYAGTATGFRIHLGYMDTTASTQKMLQWSNEYKWTLEWIGIEMRSTGNN